MAKDLAKEEFLRKYGDKRAATTPKTIPTLEGAQERMVQLSERMRRGEKSSEEKQRRKAEDEKNKTANAARQREAALQRLEAQLGKRYSRDRTRLETFNVYHPAQNEVIDRLRKISEQWPERLLRGDGLLFYGSVGTGKDHLLAAMLYAAIERGAGCMWLNGQELYGRFRDLMDTGEAEEGVIRRLAEPQVLAISDPIPAVGGARAWNLTQL